MKKLDRREFLKMASIAGTGVLAAGLPLLKTKASENTVVLITDSPEQDIRKILQSASGLIGKNPAIDSHPIRPAAQDLSVISNTQVLDPTQSGDVSSDIRTFASEMRNRRGEGNTCVTIGTRNNSDGKYVTFQVDGRTVERIDRSKTYNDIVIPGSQGDTRFSLKNGKLAAVESFCRHDICVKMGEKHSGRIICAPNKLVATIDGKRRVDGITG